ncbi:MAG: DUF4738 domain-containing protein [Flavobacteriaceae bacterium]|nr:DUF4738 domain-containing protein [Flavobacteriaceae bacterium]
MKNQILILLTTILFLSCAEQKKEKTLIEKKTVKVERADKQIDSLTISIDESVNNQNVVERYFPEEKDIVKYDTIISARNLRISIQNRFLDSFVTNEFESKGIKHIDKYRDSEKHLVIKSSNEILVDTIFKKNDFLEIAGQDFLKIADFHGYWFNGIKDDTIELFGVISKPETDWSFAFYHYFDLKTKTFKVEEYIDEEI